MLQISSHGLSVKRLRPKAGKLLELRDHAQLARLLMEDPEADRYEMGARLFDELAALRELHEREELTKPEMHLRRKTGKRTSSSPSWRMSCVIR